MAEAEAASTAARLERKVALLTKERDGLKSVLASYDEEEGAGAGHYRHLEFSLWHENYPVSIKVYLSSLKSLSTGLAQCAG